MGNNVEGTQIGEDGKRHPIEGEAADTEAVSTSDPKAETEGKKETEKVNEENSGDEETSDEETSDK